MLQMMTSDLINNVDNLTNINNSKEKDHISSAKEENNKKNNLINSTNNENNKYNYMTKIATVERSSSYIFNKGAKREIGKSSVPKNLGKLKLPKMNNESIKKIKGGNSMLQLDEEKNNNNDEHNETINSFKNDNISPKIIKITKKQNKTNTSLNSPSKISYNLNNNEKPPSSKKRNYNIRLNDINKNFSQTNPIS